MYTLNKIDKKIIALIIVSIIAVIALIYGIITPSKIKRAAMAESEKTKQIKQKEEFSQTGPFLSRKALKSSYKQWGRSPFSLSAATGPHGLKLDGILWDKKAPRAVINDVIVGAGDKIGNIIIREIRQDRVILNDGNGDFELKLGD